jgi:hypothetical protein
MQIVINTDFGGFGLSDEAIEHYGKLKKLNLVKVAREDKSTTFGSEFYKNGVVSDENYFWDHDIERSDPLLVETVLTLGEKANHWCSNLKIVTIPDDVDWEIHEYDGREHIAEKHRTWY